MGCHQSKLAMHEERELAEERANASGNTATKNTDTKQQEPLLPVLWDGVSRSKRGQWQQRLANAARAKLDPCERPAETLKRVLEGDALPDSEIQALGTRQPAIRLFLSSTFTDTEVERNALIEDVYPYLKSLGQRLRVQVYQSSEMRWGIRSEASAAHETSEICMREIKRCQQESSGISYVLILGNKYGFRPFPAKIPEEEFKLLKDEMAKQAKQTASTVTPAALNKAMEYMDEWFVLNENVVPPTRELKPVKKEHSDAWWSDIFPTLQMCLRQAATGAPGLSNERRALYVQSVTAEEIENGLFKVQPKEARDKACFVFDRRLGHRRCIGRPRHGQAVDEEAQQLLERLRAEAVPAALSPSRIKTMSIPWGPGIDLARTDHAEYMRTFADAFCDMLATDIERVAREHAFESDTVVEEAAAHAMFGNLRRRGFVSTAATQQTVDAALAHVQQRITGGKEVAAPFAICGPSGSGKTSLMAHIAGGALESLLKKHSFNIWTRFVARNANIFERTPGAVIARASLYPDQTAVFKAAETLLSTPGCRLPRVQQYNKPQELNPLVCVCSAGASLTGFEDIIFTRDSRWVCGCHGLGDVYVWEARTGKRVVRLRRPNDNAKATRIVHLPNGLVAVACEDGMVYVWNLDTHELTGSMNVFDPESEKCRVLRMTDDDALVMVIGSAVATSKGAATSAADGGGADGSPGDDIQVSTHVMLFSADFSQCMWKCTVQEALNCGQIRDNTLVSGTKSGSVIWFELQGVPAPAQQWRQSTAVEDRAALVQVARYDMERTWGLGVTALCLLPGGLDVVAGCGSSLYKLRADGTSVGKVNSTRSNTMSLSADGTIVVLASDSGRYTEVYDVDTMTGLRSVGPAPTGLVALSPDETFLAVGGPGLDTLVSVFDWKQIKQSKTVHEHLHQQRPPPPPVIAIMADPEQLQRQQRQKAMVFIASRDKRTLEFHDATTMTLVKTIDLPKGSLFTIDEMSGSHDGRVVVLHSTAVFMAVDTVAGRVHRDVITRRRSTGPCKVFFSPSSDACVVIDGCDLHVLALPDCKQVHGPEPEEDNKQQHTDTITCCVWHPQYPRVRQFVTGSEDQTARLWQLNADNEGIIVGATVVQVFTGHNGPVYSVAMCTDDQGVIVLATSATDTGIQLWKLNNGASPIRRMGGELHGFELLWLPQQRLLASYDTTFSQLGCWTLAGALVRTTSVGPTWMEVGADWIALHPSKKYIVVPSYGGFQLLHADSLEVFLQSFGHNGELHLGGFPLTVRMTCDGLYFVSQSDDEAILVHDLSRLPL
ncbi:hypothetical protein PTSG_02899 [Salpingoeca rosetta]|uniref:DUF4062 domain-containing protein n=1 Tax=Salpingoeca rosetta (strain ATCC 50818 / BSB-021) TaxID=946362 RepID=F2U3N4_SALR5|nr:uncharacterized protein PTSG_02899 [Salpingoeca rosetta]EGD82228.1 hypothetical protein PTSG_02899 [Salpingoeca rosetta]|eukprot:XP_004996411.1 hypothetical protein PTSG_02899 [Salpingoeca rosetta]